MKKMWYRQFTLKEVEGSLDDTAKDRISFAWLRVLVSLLLYLTMGAITESLWHPYTILAFLLIVLMVLYGSRVIRTTFIKAVWSKRNGTNREVYIAHKKYFDAQFVRLRLRKKSRNAKRKGYGMLYLKLGQTELAKALDRKGRNKAVAANLLPFVSIIGCVLYWMFSEKVSVVSILFGIALIVSAFFLGLHIQTIAIIESVYRGKEGRNKKIYQKNKAYFDKKFKQLRCNGVPSTKQHIIKQKGCDSRG